MWKETRYIWGTEFDLNLFWDQWILSRNEESIDIDKFPIFQYHYTGTSMDSDKCDNNKSFFLKFYSGGLSEKYLEA